MIKGFIHALLLAWFFMCGGISTEPNSIEAVVACIFVGIVCELALLYDWKNITKLI